ncbi:hypothetical protein ACFL6S_19360 [Candidatus Poribacteria bacterium]
MDSYAGLERHVYVVDGIPEGIEPRPTPEVGGSHVTSAGAAWSLQATGAIKGRSAEDLERGAIHAD